MTTKKSGFQPDQDRAAHGKSARAGRDEQAASRASLARLVRVWQRGDRCFAVMDIVYAGSGATIAEGTRGYVVGVGRSAVVVVQWEPDDEGRVITESTSPDSLDPVPA